ncbi:delta-like protein B [Mytilus trossulus]|uniref:delta-like protein B n=1 Tax=Mytilus trossulus TaxID=6551 RepID=UPI003004C4DC
MESLNMILCFTICLISFAQIIHGEGGDPCLANPCMNGATCTSNGPQYTCGCDTGYKGTHCESDTSVTTTVKSTPRSGTNSLSDGKFTVIAVGCIISVIIFL